jgi:hypothetical protein
MAASLAGARDQDGDGRTGALSKSSPRPLLCRIQVRYLIFSARFFAPFCSRSAAPGLEGHNGFSKEVSYAPADR